MLNILEEHSISCGFCNKKLGKCAVLDVETSEENKYIVKCPYCGGHSFLSKPYKNILSFDFPTDNISKSMIEDNVLEIKLL